MPRTQFTTTVCGLGYQRHVLIVDGMSLVCTLDGQTGWKEVGVYVFVEARGIYQLIDKLEAFKTTSGD
eukprot:662137-Amorphochlora_amoeboformis.AAC.1